MSGHMREDVADCDAAGIFYSIGRFMTDDGPREGAFIEMDRNMLRAIGAMFGESVCIVAEAEIRRLRARVAELERRTTSANWFPRRGPPLRKPPSSSLSPTTWC